MALSSINNTTKDYVVRSSVQQNPGANGTADVSREVLYSIFLRLTSAKDMRACSLTCKQWRAIIIHPQYDALFKRIALEKVLGKRVWEENVVEDVGEEPRYRIGGHPIPWRDVCKLQRKPSPFRVLEGTMIEVDFLVPKTMDGIPTTMNRVIEVFAKAKKPIGCRNINPAILKKYGDIPIEESYLARITFTVDEDTRHQKPADRVNTIEKKGQGLYRLPQEVEHMIYSFLAHQVGAPYGYGEDRLTYTQCVETIEDNNGTETPVMSGGLEEPAPGAPGGLSVDGDDFVIESCGAGGLRKF